MFPTKGNRTKSNLGPYYMPDEVNGVLGTPVPSRTQADMRLQAEFDRTREKYVNMRDFGPRTASDQRMQMEFNPLVREGYCGYAPAPAGDQYFHSPFARTSDNPYNNSSGATYLPLR